jgi:hypothetical protein
MKEIKKEIKSPFLFPWQLRQSLSNRFRFFLYTNRGEFQELLMFIMLIIQQVENTLTQEL